MLPAVPPCSRVPCSDLRAVSPPAAPWNWTRRPPPSGESWTACGCPFSRPARTSAFDLVLLVDDAPTMRIWEDTTARLAQAAEHSGVFRGVRTVQVNVSRSGTATLQRPTGPAAADPAELLDGRGGCVFLVVTDGFAHAGPTAVVHLLPPHLRHRSSLYPYQAVLEASGFGATDDSVPVPVLSLKPGSLAAWADLVTGERGVRRALLVVLAGTLTKGAPAPGLHTPRFPRAAKAAVRRFLTLATPSARRVATQLAAIPFDFDLVEQLRRRTMPETGPDHLAETLMGGLIDWDGGVEGRPEFADGVREELLATTTRSQLAYTIRAVGGLPAAGERGVAMRAALRDPMGASLPDPEERGWARSELAVMHALSGPYSEREKRVDFPTDTPSEGNRTGSGGSTGDGEGRDPAPTVADQSGEPVPSQVTDVTEHKAPEAEPLMQSTTTAMPALLVNVPLRNTSFVGRQALLRAVEEQLGAQDTAAVLPHALHGLGGVGKSQLVLEYIYMHQHDYKVICWIPAERESQILAALASLAAPLGVAPTGQDSLGAPAANTAVPAVLEALRTGALYDNWLLVFDNAEDVEAVRNSFPTSGRGKVIVTSRNRAWERVATPLPVNVFERQETIELPQQRSPDRSAEGEDRLADALGDPPLAVYKPSPAYTVPMSEGVAMTTPE
ncbi:SAV_2336 family protein [Streptomyces sp. NBC_01340]|uniref:SAV_2336 N-terminal domain-related protein n=1 Tax=unclassified Streptomyces TaxID=2593676 RepID=UPI0022578B90|nr:MULTISPECIES: SAV_2336 N-terminal domain-related protein [unclassified Streptomyces]MCX4457427.1 SAV_2336 N-terminal domain-related protein [Streptomyces sp. NBC_01719]MCX4496784.1 SAV_2336 N-terminal domain-related protein [Streptomyces sp. NBC_01728]WSI44359.1 SAV_2336 family protein [Streptomyces sp. NBC_01340]